MCIRDSVKGDTSLKIQLVLRAHFSYLSGESRSNRISGLHRLLQHGLDVYKRQVLGTHFNVDAYHDNLDVKTTLLSGSVAVSNKSKSVRMVLKPNEIAIYNKVEEKLTRKVLENAEDEISWRQGEFIFDDLPLQEIARELSNSFGATIQIRCV